MDPYFRPGGARPARGYVTGTVRSADGTPTAGVAIWPTSLDRPARPIPELVVATDGYGRYRWSLPPGRYELLVQPVGPGGQGTAARQPVTVLAGRTMTADFIIG
jgi:hypothetical protein